MNSTILIGNIANDLELRTTTNGKSVCSFNLAVNFNDNTDFIPIQVWGTQAENLITYQNKGSKIAVQGYVKTSQYKNSEDKTITKVFVEANRIMFLGSKQSNTNETTNTPVEETTDFENSFKSDELVLDNEDLPF